MTDRFCFAKDSIFWLDRGPLERVTMFNFKQTLSRFPDGNAHADRDTVGR
jgi:hypothetical protein